MSINPLCYVNNNNLTYKNLNIDKSYTEKIIILNTVDENKNKISIENYKNIENIYFENCEFSNIFHIMEKNLNFKDCKFTKSVHFNLFFKVKNNENTKLEFNFFNCEFDVFSIENIYNNRMFNINIFGGIIKKLNIENTYINSKFYMNKQSDDSQNSLKINSLKIKNTIFKENFKLHNCYIDFFQIEDSDFEKHADFFKSTFKNGINKENDIDFKGINFKGLALFGNTKFYKKLVFKYVTFESFSHFRKAKFYSGLDLDYVNIQNEMNFFDVEKLDTKKAKDNTSQETYRIIKHNFEKIGNRIEANKYFALELEKKKINLKNDTSSKLTDYIVFQIHWHSSEFGTNWLKVLGYILLTALVTVALVHFDLLKEVFFNPSLFKSEYLLKIINECSQYLYILDKSSLLVSHPFILLVNKILLSYLYYQFLISTRKDTRK